MCFKFVFIFCFSLTNPNQPRLKLQMAVVFIRNPLMNSLYLPSTTQKTDQISKWVVNIRQLEEKKKDSLRN